MAPLRVELTGLLESLIVRSGELEIVTPKDPSRRGAQLSIRLRGHPKHWVEALEKRGIIADARRRGIDTIDMRPLFEEGGTQAQVLRVVNSTATAGTFTVNGRSSTGAALTATAANKGTWASKLSLEFEDGVSSGTYRVTVNYDGAIVYKSGDLASNTAAAAALNANVPHLMVAAAGANASFPANTAGTPVAFVAGTENLASITDANVVLGYLPEMQRLGGDMELDRGLATQAVTKVGEALGKSVKDAAQGIYDIVNENMVGALRLVSVEQGHDPRDYALIAFGGAGPLHANALSRLLGSWPSIIPPGPGVLCALGALGAGDAGVPIHDSDETLLRGLSLDAAPPLPWYAGTGASALPLCHPRDELALTANRLRLALAHAGIRPLLARAVLIEPEDLNRIAGAAGSKGAVNGLTLAIASQYAEKGIRCNAICPGWVLTPLVQAQIDARAKADNIPAKQASDDLLREKQPQLKFTTVDQIAGANMFQWTPKQVGTLTELSPILRPFTPVLDQMTVLSNMELQTAYPGTHATANCAFLSATRAKMTESTDYRLATTVDQIVANVLKQLSATRTGASQGAVVGGEKAAKAAEVVSPPSPVVSPSPLVTHLSDRVITGDLLAEKANGASQIVVPDKAERVHRFHKLTLGALYTDSRSSGSPNVFKNFDKYGDLEPGYSYKLRARVSRHSEFGGVKETLLNYLTIVEEIEQEPQRPSGLTLSPSFADDGEPF